PPPKSTLYPYTTLFRSTSHHGLNAAWDGDLFNNRRNSSISLEDIAPLSFNKDVTQAILHATNDVNAMPELPDVETFKRYVDRTSDRKSTRLNSCHVAIS